MPGKKKADRKLLPPCPDPERYLLVTTKEGCFWRRKRGTVNGASLNSHLARNTVITGIVSPAASRVAKRLLNFTRELSTGRLTSRLMGKFNKTYKEKGRVDFSLLKGFELQPDYPLDKLLLQPYAVERLKGSIVITIPAGQNAVNRYNQLVSHFYFEAVLLAGDATVDNGMEVESTASAPYDSGTGIPAVCRLCLPLPSGAVPWMLLLKVGCIEGDTMAVHPNHYGMRVVEVGS